MKYTIPIILLLSMALLTGAGASEEAAEPLWAAADENPAGATTTQTAAAPVIMIPDPLFTFEPVVDGTEVVHDFQVYNRGETDLAIENVQTG